MDEQTTRLHMVYRQGSFVAWIPGIRAFMRLSLGLNATESSGGPPVADLVAPLAEVHASYLSGLEEFRAEGRLGPDDGSALAAEGKSVPGLEDPDGFVRYVEALRAASLEETPRPAGWVPATHLWYMDGKEWLGRMSIRHRLTPGLLERGGHIGYDVRPSRRRLGHATSMLRLAIPIARRLGIDPVLVTCDADNAGSRKVIEGNGGALEDERDGILRYWIHTGYP